MHLIEKEIGIAGTSAIVAGIVPVAVGAAFAEKLKGGDSIHCVFFGDSAMEEGAFYEALNLAALHNLPIIFFCENNYYSVCTPLDARQAQSELFKKAESFGIRSKKIDGTDVLSVYEAVLEAKRNASEGNGPSFIESVAYRLRAHGGAGEEEAPQYRSKKEVEHWALNGDPLKNYGQFLRKKDLLTDSAESDMNKKISKEISAAFAFAESAPNPTQEDLFTNVYCN